MLTDFFLCDSGYSGSIRSFFEEIEDAKQIPPELFLDYDGMASSPEYGIEWMVYPDKTHIRLYNNRDKPITFKDTEDEIWLENDTLIKMFKHIIYVKYYAFKKPEVINPMFVFDTDDKHLVYTMSIMEANYLSRLHTQRWANSIMLKP